MASLLISRPQFVQQKFSDNSQLDSLSKTPAYKCSVGNQLPLKEMLLSSLFDFFFYPERDFKDLLVQLPRCCFFFFNSIYFILAALHLHCCTRAFSSCSEQPLLSSFGAWASHCSECSCCRLQGTQASAVGPQLPCGMWDLPGPGIKPMSLPALAGRFLTTRPLRKPQ